MTQEEFAEACQIPIGTLRDLEQGRTGPDQANRAYLKVIAVDREFVKRALAQRPGGQKRKSATRTTRPGPDRAGASSSNTASRYSSI